MSKLGGTQPITLDPFQRQPELLRAVTRAIDKNLTPGRSFQAERPGRWRAGDASRGSKVAALLLATPGEITLVLGMAK